jgi:hypothetical protein
MESTSGEDLERIDVAFAAGGYESNRHGTFVRDRLTICGSISHLLDHLNDRQAHHRVGDPQECPDKPCALFRIIDLWKIDRGRPSKRAMDLSARVLFQHCAHPSRGLGGPHYPSAARSHG